MKDQNVRSSNSNPKRELDHQRLCHEETKAVEQCHSYHGINDEHCLQEELLQKKCLANVLCPHEAMIFYRQPIRKSHQQPASPRTTYINTSRNSDEAIKKEPIISGIDVKNNATLLDVGGATVSCATLFESFAFPQYDFFIPENTSQEERDMCRKVAHDLAKCLGMARRF
mmetsp:Transcript_33642/g.41205  ORF Transcript_33642/g.41205 Transcript_33642/m.41205 type:complete len:170 (+) Transcript_33642:117-626(+)|eukprot:CAMPEP_0172498952 /NCGR_PEP_ID=MMETSP1066-20121228/120120_1 /TAXON_ID=671091 /ORGANISM="Coscinodiscus wailesii, Strain CCMP2513" /LENGTH=169 /DNA_ID=CAMNT_0013272453 /DNA_START=101 /DNA_END=610 /DNA_ORIENTATION=-